MIERALAFPASASLVGVLTAPDAAPAAARPAVVWLNAGMLHRVGPNRLHVRIARHLATRGITSLRFDLSGVGDSAPRRDGLPFRAAAVRDAQDAMDAVGAERVVLAGICSGADLACRVALADTRVAGLVLIDGLPYRTRRASLHFATTRLIHYGAWRKLFAPRAVARLMRAGGPAAPTVSSGLGKRDIPPMAEAETMLRTLTERGVRILAIYTEGREYAYRRQFAHSFPSVRRDRVRVEYLEGADHTFTLRANQDRLVRTIEEWLTVWH
ncbi:MAG: alpha/beta fold hydrolase [Candidatus Rokubacteria bacterium]|nr:alpha/beta fold hydrolase [Candidatus Rokubacteria bacterium]